MQQGLHVLITIGLNQFLIRLQILYLILSDSKFCRFYSFVLENLTWHVKEQRLQRYTLLIPLTLGVDIERFAMDDEYKKETILGLAM